MDPVAHERATLIDILSHRTGLPGHDGLTYLYETSEELIQRLKDLEPTAQFREEYQYTNLMFLLAGAIAGRAHQDGWEDLIITRLLEPLEMYNTYASIRKAYKDPRTVDGFAGGVVVNRTLNLYSDRDGPAGAIVTSIGDHGLGFRISSYRGKRIIHHNGALFGFSSTLITLPEEKISVAVLTNSQTPFTPVAAQIILDREVKLTPPLASVAFSTVKAFDWNTHFKANRKRWDNVKQHEIERIENLRDPDSAPTVSFAELSGIYYHDAYGIAEVSLSTQHPKGLSIKLNDGAQELKTDHWYNNTFGLVAMKEPFDKQDGFYKPRPLVTFFPRENGGTHNRTSVEIPWLGTLVRYTKHM
ncbi:hypothetical protein HDU96_011144 [Phlyctochytrium bullatum]|nr:hypothetical protein HDU96_011144 [Phlyctochytrium bullatum]